MADLTGLVIRVVHILCGAFWAGAAIMLAGFIEPAVKSLGPDGGRFIQRLMGPGRFGVFMTMASLLAVLSGLIMLWDGSFARMGDWFASGYGRAIIVGSVAGFVAMLVGLGLNAPVAGRIARISAEIQSAGGPPKPEQLEQIARLQRRLHVAGIASALLLALTVVAMAAAHFL